MLDDWGSCKNDMWNPSICDCERNKSCKIDEYLDITKCLCKKHLFGKLVLACENEILNTTESTLANNCLIHTVSMVIRYLLLLVAIAISCYYYYTRHWIKKE